MRRNCISILAVAILGLGAVARADEGIVRLGQAKAISQPHPAHQHHAHQHHAPSGAVNPSDKSIADDPGRQFLPPPPVPEAPALKWGGAQVEAERANEYSLDSFLSWAASNNPTILQARLQITGQMAKAMQAGLYPNPNVSYVGDTIGTEGRAGEFQGMEVQQRFVTGGKLELSRNKYLQRAKAAEHLAVAQQFRVCNDVRIHFYKSLGSYQELRLQQELLKTAEDDNLTARERYNLGQATAAQVRMANVHLQKQRLETLSAENSYRQDFLELASLAAVDLDVGMLKGSLESDREVVDFHAAEDRILSQSPEVLAAWAKLREDQITICRERAEPIPDIVVKGGPGYNFSSMDPVANLSVSVNLPIFDRNQGTIRQAEADLARQQAEVQRTRLNLRKELAGEYQRYISSRQSVENYRDVILPEAKEAYRATLEAYKQDRQEWSDVLDAQKDYTDHRLEYIRQLVQHRISETLIDGYLLHDGLKPAPEPTPPGHIDATPKPR